MRGHKREIQRDSEQIFDFAINCYIPVSMCRIKTPQLCHLVAEDYEDVYEPAEDSFLMLDALESELCKMQQSRPSICLEIGSGTGILSTGLATVLKECYYIATDWNPKACSVSRETGVRNGVDLQVVQTSCASGLMKLSSKVDILLCNPPYVATDESEAEAAQGNIASAWAGGTDGCNLTYRVLRLAVDLLSARGTAYIVLEQCNDPKRVLQAAEGFGLSNRLVLHRRAGREVLFVYAFHLKHQRI